MRAITVALLVGLSLFAGCGPDPGRPPGHLDDPVAGPEEPMTMSPTPGGDVHDGGGGPTRVRARPGMADLRRVPWERARPLADGGSVRITYWSGVEPCNVLDHVDVEYSKSKITITLYEGHDPEAGDVACIELAVQKVVSIPLERPLGGRKLVDGAN